MTLNDDLTHDDVIAYVMRADAPQRALYGICCTPNYGRNGDIYALTDAALVGPVIEYHTAPNPQNAGDLAPRMAALRDLLQVAKRAQAGAPLAVRFTWDNGWGLPASELPL